MSNLITTQINQLATRFDLPQSEELYNVLKATAFKGDVSDAQLSALLIVAGQYGLNPWTKEIYAFPDKKNGIIPVVSVDGWSRIINSHPAFDGMDFNFAEEMVMMDGANSPAPTWTECVIHRKDRSHPTVIREYLDEVYKAPFRPKDGGYTVAGPWQTHPKRFSRHKAMIQCARMAFGFGGIYDADEADRILEATAQQQPKRVDPDTGEISKALPAMPKQKFDAQLPKWADSVANGGKVADLMTMLQSKYTLTAAQMDAINSLSTPTTLADDEFVREMEGE
jgi:phage recombination protein Bet